MREVAFVGKNLNEMASTLLDVFRSRRIALYDHPALIADLGRLSIEEKSYGHRLSATRTEEGHADLATALAIALPIAVEQSGKVPRINAIFGGSTAGHFGSTQREPGYESVPQSSWQRAMDGLERERRLLIEEHERRTQTPDEWIPLERGSKDDMFTL